MDVKKRTSSCRHCFEPLGETEESARAHFSICQYARGVPPNTLMPGAVSTRDHDPTAPSTPRRFLGGHQQQHSSEPRKEVSRTVLKNKEGDTVFSKADDLQQDDLP